jgi:hypothetical protein
MGSRNHLRTTLLARQLIAYVGLCYVYVHELGDDLFIINHGFNEWYPKGL